MRAAMGTKHAAKRRQKVVLANNPDLRRARNGEPDARFGEGKEWAKARAEIVQADAQKVSAQRSYGAGKKLVRGGKIAAATGGLAGLAALALGERARRQARNPKKDPGPKPDSKVTGTERVQRLAALAPAKRPVGAGVHVEDDTRQGQIDRVTPKGKVYGDWLKSGKSGDSFQRDLDRQERARQWEAQEAARKRAEDDGAHTPWRES
jgi:hypothetical protein